MTPDTLELIIILTAITLLIALRKRLALRHTKRENSQIGNDTKISYMSSTYMFKILRQTGLKVNVYRRKRISTRCVTRSIISREKAATLIDFLWAMTFSKKV